MGMDGMGWDLRVDRRFEARKRSDIERIEGGGERETLREAACERGKGRWKEIIWAWNERKLVLVAGRDVVAVSG
jgi:hypothetical protein